MTLVAAGGLPVTVVQLIAFVILATVLYLLVWRRIQGVLKSRSEGIQASFDDIDTKQKEVETSTSDYTTKLKDVEVEGGKRIDGAVKEGERMRDDMEAEAKKDRGALLEKVGDEIRIEREKAVIELRQEAARMAVELAERMVEASVDDKLQQRSVDRYLESLDKVKPV